MFSIAHLSRAARVTISLVVFVASSLLLAQLPHQREFDAPLPAEAGDSRREGPARRLGDVQFRQGRQGRAPSRADYPMWENAPGFTRDVFTFARIQYDSYGMRGGGMRGGQSWSNDYPDCDWNFSVRLKELTSLKVHPEGQVLRLTDPELFDLPFIYMSNVQGISLSEEEIVALRRYLENGGFVMMDDFWAPAAWRHVREVMEQVLPGRAPQELTLDHDIFQVPYPLKEMPQVPSILAWRSGETFENWHEGPQEDEAPHFYGMHDAKGRLVALLCHNNDIGDGWEREGDNREYFEKFSNKVSYPLGINIITYAMTH